jgi:hypothetical protein
MLTRNRAVPLARKYTRKPENCHLAANGEYWLVSQITVLGSHEKPEQRLERLVGQFFGKIMPTG